jgi:hypothetical protein
MSTISRPDKNGVSAVKHGNEIIGEITGPVVRRDLEHRDSFGNVTMVEYYERPVGAILGFRSPDRVIEEKKSNMHTTKMVRSLLVHNELSKI